MLDKKLEAKNKRLQKTYGITLEEWENGLKAQGNVCAVCGKLPPSGRLNLDHIHVKGFKKMPAEQKRKYVRGACCFICNTTIGKLERSNNSRQLLNNIIKYFQIYSMKGEI